MRMPITIHTVHYRSQEQVASFLRQYYPNTFYNACNLFNRPEHLLLCANCNLMVWKMSRFQLICFFLYYIVILCLFFYICKLKFSNKQVHTRIEKSLVFKIRGFQLEKILLVCIYKHAYIHKHKHTCTFVHTSHP